MNSNSRKTLHVSVLLLGTESGGIRTFLLNQQARAVDFGLNFRYVALQDGSMCAELRKHGGQVAILNAPLPVTLERSPVYGVARWMSGKGFGEARRALLSHLHKEKPDLLYSHFLHTHLVCGVVGRKLGIPRVGQVHGTLNRRRMLGITRIAYSHALRTALDRIVMVSNTAMASLSNRARLKASMVYNGIDGQAVETASKGIPKTPGRIILLGRIVPGKKVDVAIRAMPTILKAGISCTLDIVGGPLDQTNDYANECRKLAIDLGVAPFINFTGPINPPYTAMTTSEVCVNCSTVEGLSYVVMEAMLCGTPIIVANRGAPSEMIQHDATGLHFAADDPEDLGHAVVRLLSDRNLRERLSTAARVYAREKFDINNHMQGIRAVFDDFIAKDSNQQGHPEIGIDTDNALRR